MRETTKFSVDDFYSRLNQRVSDYNARLTIQSALITSGLDRNTTALSQEQAKAVCLALINKGGPAFQVGRDMYQRVQ